MGIYLQAYGLKVDETTHKNNATVEVEITQGDKSIVKTKQTTAELDQNGEQLTVEKVLPGGALQPGKYKLQIHVTDTLANQTLERCGGGPCTVDFTVTEAPVAAAQKSSGR
jgi:5-hydroxyisourate hydrolase-like protein (transthyretin family)